MLVSLHTGDIKEIESENEETPVKTKQQKNSITYLNLKKNQFNVDCHYLLQILTPLTLTRFHQMCFKEGAPYSFGYWMELQGRGKVKVGRWQAVENWKTRRVSYYVSGGSWLSKNVDVKILATQKYSYDK